jgi:hypothetical protein
MSLQARIDELETEQHRQSWDQADDVVDDTDDEYDVTGLFDDEGDESVVAEQAADVNPMTQDALNAMSPEQRAYFTGES